MEIGQLRAFVIAAREKSFTRAAATLYVTQPSVTARIQELEKELALPLFLRKGRTIELTDGGKVFLPYAERALSILDEGNEAIRNVREGTAGRLTIGAIQAVCQSLIAPVLERFHKCNPNIEIFLRSERSTEVIEMLLDDVVQLGVASGPIAHSQIKTLAAFEDTLTAVTGTQHPFAQRRDEQNRVIPVEPDELAAEEFIVARWGPAFELFMSLLSDVGHRPAISMELSNTDTAKVMLKMNMGVSVLPRFAIKDDLESRELVEIPIKDWKPVPLQIVLMHRRDHEMSLPSQRFVELWKQSISHYPPELS